MLTAPAPIRRRYEIRGQIQGVGFRPFAYRLARELGLSGFVRNHSEGVTVELEGDPETVARWAARLPAELPPPGRVDAVSSLDLTPVGQLDFAIVNSLAQGGETALVLPDLATCAACRAEVLAPGDRRSGYAFTNCTQCGPRFTIVREVPYDRPQTTMAGFELCAVCRAEYLDPEDRRFHAQPNACPDCGPALELDGAADPLAAAVARLRAGEILALKGLGGYHLACDARQEAAVRTLRSRKQREARPLAVMVAGLEEAAALAVVGPVERELLESAAAPIVLLDKLPDHGLAESVAPESPRLGLMLAYSPLHILLLESFGGPLVMTSGNRHDEPIAHRDDDAGLRLGGIADAILRHNRPIERRCDDSVVAVWGGRPVPFRRSRGYAPDPLRVGGDGPTVLAVGAHQKNTFCFLRGGAAFLSHHIGDLENEAALESFETGIADFERLFDLPPARLACDLHPDYLATAYARRRAERDGLPLVEIQHHHAHIASCLADHGRDEPALGVSFDGTGIGDDGTIWGGEFLLAEGASYQRLGALFPFKLPGGVAAVREGWRVAVALAEIAGATYSLARFQVAQDRAEFVADLLDHDDFCPTTTSAGRLFDGVSALAGIRGVSRYEGEAAVLLEAACGDDDGALPFAVVETGDGPRLDWRPAIRELLRDEVSPAVAATRFHRGLAQGVATFCRRLADGTGLTCVAVSGGCAQNLTWLTFLAEAMAAEGLELLTHHRVPPNDGGLSLGQAMIARAREERN